MNKDNIRALWDTLTPKLYGYLINTLRDKNLAEDVLQTTWLKATINIASYKEGDAGFSAWLFAIARNECRQHWRKGVREVAFDPAVHDVEDEAGGSVEDKILVDQILAQLSETDRAIMQLRYIAGLPLNDIARILKINPVAARVRVHRATRALKAVMQNE